ncbi:hypothetical protein AB834_01170 [PVC group bacterium (ex Bugula neritina AB1)]|nr:hypothetical protein AB834_01170 [PVC group bacterium (ex Bugula neritina AB1)]
MYIFFLFIRIFILLFFSIHSYALAPISEVSTKNFCYICRKQFNKRSFLDRHLNTVHSDAKPFSCETCSQQFNNKTNLNRHCKEVHSNVRGFSCNLCGAKFARKYQVNLHLTVHSVEKNFDCNRCDKKFTTRSNLKRHFKKAHSDASADPSSTESPYATPSISEYFATAYPYAPADLSAIPSTQHPPCLDKTFQTAVQLPGISSFLNNHSPTARPYSWPKNDFNQYSRMTNTILKTKESSAYA